MADTHRHSEQYQLRLPEGLRDEIKAAAAANGRSMNAEIILRLQSNEQRSLRDWLACQELPQVVGLIGIPEGDPDELWNASIAAQAYGIADAMLAERQKS